MDIKIVRSVRARRISLTVKHTGEVRLTVPRGVSDAEAMRFAESKREWMERAVRRVEARKPAQAIISMPYSTLHHTLYLDPSATRRVTVRIDGEAACGAGGGRIVVSYPAEVGYEAAEVQAAIKKGIEEAWRIEAKEYLPVRVQELAGAFKFRCGEVTIRNTRSRWGSCSPTNDISLSLHLMKLPPRLIDYILIHELCHTVHKNHGPKFHALLDKCLGGEEQALRRELKKYSTRW